MGPCLRAQPTATQQRQAPVGAAVLCGTGRDSTHTPQAQLFEGRIDDLAPVSAPLSIPEGSQRVAGG